jgi:hypothetical protein
MTAQVVQRDKLGSLTKISQGGQGVVHRAPNVKTKFAEKPAASISTTRNAIRCCAHDRAPEYGGRPGW